MQKQTEEICLEAINSDKKSFIHVNQDILEGLISRGIVEYKTFKKEGCKDVDAYKFEGVWYFFIGHQHAISKEVFIDRIHNEDGGLEENPHRQHYLDFLDII